MSTSSTTDDAATCWLCLDDGPDESGQPLRRDCSCRGNSGFAHLRCIIDYAAQASRGMSKKKDTSKFVKVWTQCPNCEQGYQHDLADELIVSVCLM